MICTRDIIFHQVDLNDEKLEIQRAYFDLCYGLLKDEFQMLLNNSESHYEGCIYFLLMHLSSNSPGGWWGIVKLIGDCATI